MGGGVGHAEEHDSGFIESLVGNEGGLPLVAVFDLDIVISPSHIKLGKDLGIFEFVDEVRDQGKGVCISDSMTVKVSVVLTGSEASILFLDEEEGRSLGGFGWVDLPRAKILVNELIHGFLFLDGEGIKFSYFWNKGFFKFYGMVIGSGWEYVVCGLF